MNTYLLLLRGINVGGNNKIPMAELKKCLEDLGYRNVVTLLNTGNVIADTAKTAEDIKKEVEEALAVTFATSGTPIKVLVLTRTQLQSVIDNKPKGFGEEPGIYHTDVIFLMDIALDEALPVFDPRESVDRIWSGDGVIYSQRLSAERTKSRLGKIVGTKPYKSMTIRTFNTTKKLLALMQR